MSARERLVVVGHGMAATRLVEGLVSGGYRGEVTLLGDEPEPAYNRILLSAVLEGSHRREALSLRSREWYAERGVDLRLGARVLAVDLAHEDVMLVDGTTIPWDRLVLATGALPTLPPIRGLVRMDGTLHPAVHAFRSIADCDGLAAALPGARRAVVVGGGLLGLQVARALAVRGLATEVVEGSEHLLSRQVTGGAGAVLARNLRRLDTEVYTGTRAIRLHDHGGSHPTPRGGSTGTSSGRGAPGVGLQLDNGFVLDTDLVVLTAGSRPATGLARNAGLAVRRGVVVDDALTSPTHPRVHAIGDCAQHGTGSSGRTTGFVAPAWEQAAVLVDRLTGRHAAYTGARSVARLRATGLDVAVLGDPQHETGDEVVVTNPVAGSHRSIVVRDGRVVAATLVGDLSRVGLITQCYDRGRRLGLHEPGRLLMGERAAPATTPEWQLPDDAEVCACAGVTAGAVRRCGSLDDVRATTRATTGCGGCAPTVRQLLATRPALTG